MTDYILPVDLHNQIVDAAYQSRGFSPEESAQAARFCQLAAWHGIKTHNAIKALHLDDLFGSRNPNNPGCVPNASIDILPSKFKATECWNANRKLGMATLNPLLMARALKGGARCSIKC